MYEARKSMLYIYTDIVKSEMFARHPRLKIYVESIHEYTIEKYKPRSCGFIINAMPQNINIRYSGRAYQQISFYRIEINHIISHKFYFFMRNNTILSLVCSHAKSVKNRAIRSYDILKNIQDAEGLLCNCIFT